MNMLLRTCSPRAYVERRHAIVRFCSTWGRMGRSLLNESHEQPIVVVTRNPHNVVFNEDDIVHASDPDKTEDTLEALHQVGIVKRKATAVRYGLLKSKLDEESESVTIRLQRSLGKQCAIVQKIYLKTHLREMI